MVSYDLNLLVLPPPTPPPPLPPISLVIFEEPIFFKINLEKPFFFQVNLEWSSQQNWHTSEFKQVV